MSNRIHQLSSEVANQIAAGEVIERPANAIKELVENSLDAGARRVTIEIEEGGKKLIRVRDDGYGMSAGDAVLSLQPHATSKITDANDLWSVQTLGFRGEALPSLASVSRLEMTTREEGSEIGTQLVAEAGTVLDVREVGCAPGTEIVVRSLFFNTPARFKFLKSDSSEAARITEMVGHLALAYPDVSFLLKHNGRELLRVDANGDALNALVAILGRDVAKQMLPIIPNEEVSNIQVSGFVGRPQLTRANRNGQLFFVNRRIIRSASLQHAFKAAYEGLIHGHDRHPLGVVFLQVAPGEVDVNVHPTKSEVRFVKDAEAHHALRLAIRNTLVGAQLAPSWGLGRESQQSRALPKSAFGHDHTSSGGNSAAATPPKSGSGGSFTNGSKAYLYQVDSAPSPSSLSKPLTPQPTEQDRQRFAEFMQEVRSGTRPKFEPANVPTSAPIQPVVPTRNQPLGTPASQPLSSEPQAYEDSGSEVDTFPMVEPKPSLKLRPIAQITKNAYMVCESADGLYIVNQHRAHERILADNAIAAARLKPVEAQLLVIPFTVEVGARALAAFEEHGELLGQLGFDVEPFGGSSLVVRSVPTLVAKGNYERVFGDLLDELVTGNGGRGLEEQRDALLTMLACKNAIKAGDPLPMEAMQRLVDDLAQVENPSICPHGQPILFKISGDELHRRFER